MTGPQASHGWIASLRTDEARGRRFVRTCVLLAAGAVATILATMAVNPGPGPVRAAFALFVLALLTLLAIVFPAGSIMTGRTIGVPLRLLNSPADLVPARDTAPVRFWTGVLFWTALSLLFLWISWRVLLHTLAQ